MRVFLFISLWCLAFFPALSQNEKVAAALAMPDSEAKTDSLRKCALDYEHSNIDSCQLLAQSALELAQKIKYARGESSAYLLLGICQWEKGNLKQSSVYYLKSLRICEKTKNTDGEITCLTNLGALYSEHGNHTMALEYLYSAKHLAIKTGNSKRLPTVYNTIGYIYSKKNKIDSARQNYDHALEIYTATHNLPGKAEIYNNYAVLFRKQGDLEQAIYYHQKDVEICRELNDTYNLAIGLNNLSWITFEAGNTAQAMGYGEQALAICLEKNYTDNVKYVYMNLHNIYAKAGDYKKAYQYLDRYVAINDSLQGMETKKVIEELSVRYQTEKKQYHIDSLSRENRIKGLENVEKDAALASSRNMRNIIVALFIIALLGALVWINQYRNQQQRKQLELEKLNLQMEQNLLRTQMNPHFIFNALNSIQGFIAEQQGLSAQRFLAKFSQLMRYVLEYNSKDYVLLEDDTKVLQIYMELEQLRFNDIFSFEILTAGTDMGTWQIPPMIAQPFVENAILHGLQHKTGKGVLTVELKEENEVLTMLIRDNGVGRKKAAELRRDIPGKKRSMGMELAKQRLALLNTKRENKITYTVEDLYTPDGHPDGTLVRIIVPWESIN